MYLSGRNSKSVRGSPMKLRGYLGLAAHHEREVRVFNRVITWRSSEAGDALSLVDHSFRENSDSSSSHFRESAGKPAALFSHK